MIESKSLISFAIKPSHISHSVIVQRQSFIQKSYLDFEFEERMPVPSRDRLPRPVDISTLLRCAARKVDLIVDEPGLLWAGLSEYSGGRSSNRSRLIGRENRTPATIVRRGGGRSRGTRTPLRNITGITRAFERRRAQFHNNQLNQASQEENNAQLEHEMGDSTPITTIVVKSQLSSPSTQVWKIMANIADKNGLNSDLLTPQKKLMNSIEKVREVWLNDRRKLERTPVAKRAEREKKVRILMSMR